MVLEAIDLEDGTTEGSPRMTAEGPHKYIRFPLIGCLRPLESHGNSPIHRDIYHCYRRSVSGRKEPGFWPSSLGVVGVLDSCVKERIAGVNNYSIAIVKSGWGGIGFVMQFIGEWLRGHRGFQPVLSGASSWLPGDDDATRMTE